MRWGMRTTLLSMLLLGGLSACGQGPTGPAVDESSGKVATTQGADTKQVQLGKKLLGSAFTRVTLDYDEYYAQGPTGPNTVGGYHPGIDYSAAVGTTVYSPVKGVVHSFDADGKGIGRLSIKIDGTTGPDYFIFLHLSKVNVKRGRPIKVGDVIGKSGKQGTGAAHLHVELRTGKFEAAYYFKTKDATGVNKNPTSILP